MSATPTIRVQSAGQPVALSGIARLLLAMHRQQRQPRPAALHLVNPTPVEVRHEASSAVPAQ